MFEGKLTTSFQLVNCSIFMLQRQEMPGHQQ